MNPFKTYDIRGIYPFEIYDEFAFELGRAVVKFLGAKKLIIGRDGRNSSDELYTYLIEGIVSQGCDVVDIGRCSTPQFYFEIFSGTANGGIMITASHNPKEFNGFKICGSHAKPIFSENGFEDIQKLMDEKKYSEVAKKGHAVNKNFFNSYISYFAKLHKPIDKKLNVVFDCGNGMGITEVKALKKIYGSMIDETVLFPIIDGTFPNHECDPTKVENTLALVEEMKRNKYDLGFAFDGDADRVVCFTSSGFRIPSDVLTAIIAKQVCVKGDKVGYEVRTSQSVVEELKKDKFVGCMYPSGHSLIKKNMIKDGAVFAGEKSGHYFYQKLHYVESTLFSVMQVIEFSLNNDIEKIAKEISGRRVSLEEKNYKVNDKDSVLKLIEKEFRNEKIVKVDGLSVYSDKYFFNIRKSNTENLIRLNIEGDTKKIVNDVVEKIEKILARS